MVPFQNPVPMVFSKDYVERYVPPVSGVYGLSNAREWVYVGESDNIRASLAEQLNDPGSPVMERKPTGFTFEVCPSDRRHGRQDRLIQELEPVCNRSSAGREGPPMRIRRAS